MKVTDWFRNPDVPARIGYYEVRNCGGWTRRNKLVAGFIDGRQLRYWDGSSWLTEKSGAKSIMGRCNSHQWRGLAKKP